MPSPIAHSVSGYAIARISSGDRGPVPRSKLQPWLYGIGVANAADLDFIPQFLTGTKYHHGFSHSLLFCLGVSVCVYIAASLRNKTVARAGFWLTLALYGSHLLLDFFTDGGDGIQLFWPFAMGYFRSPTPLFPSTHWSEPLLQHPGHWLFLGVEVVYSLFLVGIVQFWSARRRKEKWQNRF
ncbi:metal-dependent hydrolase [Altericista sp. CCNU0014]|uniref:metal-dependent hydrolase n=1 Tax=Altericista sp. CCNU0014 TaxID=3082949 RepID=UPI00384F1D91